MIKISQNTIYLLFSLVFIGCGGGGGGTSGSTSDVSSEEPTAVGYYLDSGVEGIKYICGDNKVTGITSEGGKFKHIENDSCKFYLNNILIRSISKTYDGIKVYEDNVTVARVLQSLDNDADPSNGIKILPEVAAELSDILPSSDEDVKELVDKIKTKVDDYKGDLVSIDDAKLHLDETILSDKPKAYDIELTTFTNDSIEFKLKAEDPQGEKLKYIITKSPANGTLTGEAPSLVYTPKKDFDGDDSFIYKVNDGSLDSDEATVSIHVKSINEPPLYLGGLEDINTIDSANINIDVSSSFKEVDNEIVFRAVDLPNGLSISDNGLISGTINNLASDNSPYNVTIYAKNSNNLETNATFKMIVTNPTPVAKDDNITIDEDTNISIDVLANDSDDDDGLTFSIKTNPSNGSVTLDNNLVTYAPNTNFNGLDKFVYKVVDSQGAVAEATVNIKINSLNDTPISKDINITTDEDTNVTINLNATDVDGDDLTYVITTQPENGTLTAEAPNLVYTPNPNFNGNDSFKYKVNDGTTDSEEATVNITINPINDAPTITLSSTQLTAKQYELFTLVPNATDVEGDELSYELINAPSWLQIDTATGKVYGTPKLITDINKTKDIQIKVSDGLGGSDVASFDLDVIRVQRLLVIRIEFNDYKFRSSEDVWSKKIFGFEDHELNDYFKEISYGRFLFKEANETYNVNNDGLITVSLDEDHPNPGSEGTSFLDELVDAVNLADEYIDFSAYDTNEDSAISYDELQIMFLVAGGESATGASPGVWAHMWCFYGGNAEAPTVDGVKIMECGSGGNYSRFGEKHFDADDGDDATIGVIAHELGHAALKLPDLYDTDGSSAGIGRFGLMSGGSWGRKPGENSGATPVHMCGWSKIKSNFVEPITIETNSFGLGVVGTATADYTLYKIPTTDPKEYFLVENREANGYDLGLSVINNVWPNEYNTSSIAIWHIDENIDNNKDETHKLVDLEEANDPGLDTNDNGGDLNNLFFNGNSNSFTPDTTPNSNLYDGSSSSIWITNISDSDTNMTLDISFQ